MKKLNFILFVLIITVFNVSCTESQTVGDSEKKSEKNEIDTLSFLRETSSVLKTPESVKYDSQNHILYVANINGNPTEKDENGFISKVSLDGKIIDKKWVTGLNAPKGMGIFGDKLYVSDIDRLVEISIKKAVILKTYPAKDAEFLNDIDVDEEGNVYVSDMSSDRIFRLKGTDFSLWLQSPEFVKPNGLFVDKKNLLVGVKNKILSVDIQTKEITTLADNTGSIDGLEGIGNNQYIFSDWSGHIHITNLDGSIKLVLNTAKDSIQAADIEYCAEGDLILVPTFYHNTISFYKLIRK